MRPPPGIAFESSDSAPQIELALEAPMVFAGGQGFGRVGAYESMVGRVHFGINPGALYNHGITDLDKAPRDAGNLVRCTTDIAILKPVEAPGGNTRLLFEFSNRGAKHILENFNDAPAPTNVLSAITDAGNGFLMREGYTIVWAAWQGDVLPGDGRIVADVPIATENGAPLTGLVRSEFIADRPGRRCFPLSGFLAARSYPTVSRDTRHASLTARQYRSDSPIVIPPSEWSFSLLELDSDGTGTSALFPSDTHLYLPEGFRPGWIYELAYEAKNPLVLGLGYAMVRDLLSFLRYEREDRSGSVNPLADFVIYKAYCWGRSQAGRVVRDYVYRGFNADWCGRRVFDGAMPTTAGAGRIWFNHRFAQPTRLAGLQHEDTLCYADRFPFSYATSTNHLTGETDGLLRRPATDPLIFHIDSSTEYWNRRGSLVHTNTRGEDLDQPDNVRIYLIASSQHSSDPSRQSPVRGIGELLMNPVRTTAFLRALLVCLDQWAREGEPPPPSCFPTVADGTLVPFARWREQFPDIPHVTLPPRPNGLPVYDYGPAADEGFITINPPELREDAAYTVLVPSVDEDGNERGGVRAPAVQAPLGTYIGWNVRERGLSPGVLASLEGGYIPFPETHSEKSVTGDPRASVEQRYSTGERYRDDVAKASSALLNQRFLLQEDVDRILKAAELEATLNTLWRMLSRLKKSNHNEF